MAHFQHSGQRNVDDFSRGMRGLRVSQQGLDDDEEEEKEAVPLRATTSTQPTNQPLIVKIPLPHNQDSLWGDPSSEESPTYVLVEQDHLQKCSVASIPNVPLSHWVEHSGYIRAKISFAASGGREQPTDIVLDSHLGFDGRVARFLARYVSRPVAQHGDPKFWQQTATVHLTGHPILSDDEIETDRRMIADLLNESPGAEGLTALLHLAHILDIPPLVDVCCTVYAVRIQSATPATLRTVLAQPNLGAWQPPTVTPHPSMSGFSPDSPRGRARDGDVEVVRGSRPLSSSSSSPQVTRPLKQQRRNPSSSSSSSEEEEPESLPGENSNPPLKSSSSSAAMDDDEADQSLTSSSWVGSSKKVKQPRRHRPGVTPLRVIRSDTSSKLLRGIPTYPSSSLSSSAAAAADYENTEENKEEPEPYLHPIPPPAPARRMPRKLGPALSLLPSSSAAEAAANESEEEDLYE